MRTRDLFALGVRLFGIWLICRGATYVASFVDLKLYPASEKAKDSAAAVLIYATIDFSLAALFLLWTRAVVSWSYGEDSDDDAKGRGMPEKGEIGTDPEAANPIRTE